MPATTLRPPPTAAPGAPIPPFPVTQLTLHLIDRSRPTISHGRLISSSRSLIVQVWVPQPAERWPLVVFGHGFEVGPAPYATLLEAWAAHGYVVAAPEFPLTDIDVAGSNLDEADIVNQPGDIRFVTDYLISAGSPVADRIDPAAVAVAGHSDGAEAALAAGTAPAPAGEPAYRAIVVFGVQPVPGPPARDPPILVGQGNEDQINPPSNGYATYDRAASPKYLMVLRGAGHLPPLEAGSPWLPGIEAISEAFLDAYLAGDRPASAVTAASSAYPLVSLEAG